MARILEEDGETRRIGGWRHREFKVLAERVDCDTPYVHIYQGDDRLITLTDGQADQLMNDIAAALRILPTSK